MDGRLEHASEISWLHLSDFHFGKGQDWQQQRVMNALQRDVIGALEKDDLLPNWVCITGDIANKGLPTEYAAAVKAFDKLANAMGHDPVRDWFLVPGNHDVNRNSIGPFQKKQRQLFDRETVNEILTNAGTLSSFAERQSPFFTFTKDFLGAERAFTAKQPWRVEIREVAGLTIAFLCLNSAWACQDDEDARRIALGEYQVQQALNEARDRGAHLKIALFHHPFEDLREDDRVAVKDLLTAPDGCQFMLRGHLHDSELVYTKYPDSDCFPTAAGACWVDSTYPHRVNWTRLDLANRRIDMRVWSYAHERAGHWALDRRLYRNGFDGKISWPIPDSWRLHPGHSPQPPKASPSIPSTYRRWVQSRVTYSESLNLDEGSKEVRLADLYYPLDTSWETPEEEAERKKKEEQAAKEADRNARLDQGRGGVRRPLDDLLNFDDHRHFLIKGDPGSGKSTFLKYTAYRMLTNEASPCHPILLELKDFADWLDLSDKPATADSLLLWAEAELTSFGISRETLAKESQAGRLCWLLDGLDEVFVPEKRLAVAKILGQFNHCHGEAARVLITTRPHAWAQAGIQEALCLAGRVAPLLSLSQAGQRKLLIKWFEGASPNQGEDLQKNLARRAGGHPRIREMMENPLLLTVIATIFHAGKNLPEYRVELYERAIDVLLTRRFGHEAEHQNSERVPITRGLRRVARAMYEHNRVRSVPHELFVSWFRSTHDDEEKAAALVRRIGARSGFLRARGEPPEYAFSHLGFQEYLAALGFAAEADPFAVLEKHLDQGAWEEVILLTGAYLAKAGTHGGETFYAGLVARAEKEPEALKPLLLATKAAAEAPQGTVDAGAIRILQDRAQAWIANGKGEPEARQELGLALGRLGDPRLERNESVQWVKVAKGSFMMGSEAEEDSQPIHRVTISRDFYLSRYPVTNQEFAAFMNDRGYETEGYWSVRGWRWHTQSEAEFETWWQAFREKHELEEQVRKYFQPGLREPFFWNESKFNGRNQPVVGVSKYEAEAYCGWLKGQLDREPTAWWKMGEMEVRLPREAEWEYAARGPEGRTYPWGDAIPDRTRANYDVALRNTSVVGLYPQGTTAEGLWDMAGNVWEWCEDDWKEDYRARGEEARDPVGRVDGENACLRGGSWFNRARGLPAACRFGRRAGVRGSGVGFRCCCVAVPRAEP
ncbi:SUMF1/EgtB/PvdO family nonheme iron enzyme [Sulfidibacter corallicola]|uniref:SUMF1/EgtB/PvdO family nonheme iron enzyme n=1 Tax=Sulfidibacter corallicola TaxID=2818388 RepID=A0A8A4TNY3_SULCO|nr:SUMF1/EgtB/PvdO family nonheme iron enzyme [Sulfidibacter corallicola]QTD48295.1 SUMF1/EgtB/PvdO family nonheme iron enzyme [Sulfidibacter corallicola]